MKDEQVLKGMNSKGFNVLAIYSTRMYLFHKIDFDLIKLHIHISFEILVSEYEMML